MKYKIDDRRTLVVPGSLEKTIPFCVDQFFDVAQKAIDDHDYFAIALSGGSTPKKVYERIPQDKRVSNIAWNKVLLFWSDERSVPPDHPDSNYHMAMEAGFARLPIPRQNIFRMEGEKKLTESALAYETLIQKKLKNHAFDLILLGLGEDGHTASLFPHTKALHVKNRLVLENYIPQHQTWRVTFTYDLINAAENISFYVFGAQKAEILAFVFTSAYDPEECPSQKVGTPSNPALWIADEEAGKKLLSRLK